VGIAGCAIREYSPAVLPTFMHEENPAGAVLANPPPALATSAHDHLPLPGPTLTATPLTQLAVRHETVARHQPAGETEEARAEDTPRDGQELPAPRTAAPAGISLDHAILATLRADPKLRAALENISQTQADLLTSSLPPNPTLTADALLLPLRRIRLDQQGGPPQTDLLLAYPIDWFLFGKRAAAIESARLGVDVSAADYADQVRQRVANVIAAYYDLLEARALYDLARQDLETLSRVQTMTAERVKLGGAPAVDLDRARLAVFDARREARNREVALAAALSKFRAFLGPAGADPALDVAGSLDVPNPVNPPSLKEMLALAGQTRPDIISLRRQISKAEAAIRSERAKAWPSLAPSLGYTEQFQHSIGFRDFPSWDVSINLSLPLFDRNQGNVNKASSTEAQAALSLQAQLSDLRAEIEQTVDAFRIAYANVTTNDPEQLRTARDVRDRIEGSYKAGGKTLLELLDAERAYRDARRTYILGQSTYWHSLHRLNAAVGKQVLR
jgi:cobalt-zinc-cadmium efflux system outer membrane protein